MRAVAVDVHRVGITSGKVPAVDVVDVAVAVVVDAVTWNLAGVHPDVVGQVFVGVVNARVDHGDDDTPGAGRDIPGLGSIDVGVRRAAELSGVVQAPELVEVDVVGVGRRAVKHKVGLDIGHARLRCGPSKHLGLRRARCAEVVEAVAEGIDGPACGEHEVGSRSCPHHPAVDDGFGRNAVPGDRIGLQVARAERRERGTWDRGPRRREHRRAHVVGNAIVSNEWPKVVVIVGEPIDGPSAPAGIGHEGIVEGVGVDRDQGGCVVAEVVAHDHRLGATHKDGSGGVVAAAKPRGVDKQIRKPIGVGFNPAVGETEVGLVDLEDVELVEATLDRCGAAAKADVGTVEACLGADVEHEATPVARSVGVGQRTVGVKRAASPVAVVGKAGEDHAIARLTLGDQLRSAPLKLDAGLRQLDHDSRIDRQPTTLAGFKVSVVVKHIAASTALNDQVFGKHIDDISARQASGDGELRDRAASCR